MTGAIVFAVCVFLAFLAGVAFKSTEHNEAMKAANSEIDALQATVVRLQGKISEILDEKVRK